MHRALDENIAFRESLVVNELVLQANQLVLAIYSRKSTETN